MSTVVRTDAARDQLADIYVDTPAAERDELVRVVLQSERKLADGAQFVGESRGGNSRVMFAPRVTFFFDLLPHGVIEIIRVRPSKLRWTDGDS